MQMAAHSSVLCRGSWRWIRAVIWATADYIPTVSHDQQTSGSSFILEAKKRRGKGMKQSPVEDNNACIAVYETFGLQLC